LAATVTVPAAWSTAVIVPVAVKEDFPTDPAGSAGWVFVHEVGRAFWDARRPEGGACFFYHHWHRRQTRP
jgi:hypothetical protein